MKNSFNRFRFQWEDQLKYVTLLTGMLTIVMSTIFLGVIFKTKQTALMNLLSNPGLVNSPGKLTSFESQKVSVTKKKSNCQVQFDCHLKKKYFELSNPLDKCHLERLG